MKWVLIESITQGEEERVNMETIELTISVCPEDPVGNVNAVAMALVQKDLASAKRYLDRSEVHNAQLLNNLGVYHLMKQEFHLARHYFENAMDFGLNDAEHYLRVLFSIFTDLYPD